MESNVADQNESQIIRFAPWTKWRRCRNGLGACDQRQMFLKPGVW
jgi:hypothetical protein